MNILHKIFNKLGRYRLIFDRRTGAEYMHRYYLFLKDRKNFPFNVTLHKIVRSDDPVFHDHPWSYTTIILKGGYWEHTPIRYQNGMTADQKTWRGPGSIIHRKAEELHWLELDPEVGPATTLFFMGPQVREWGFIVRGYQWVRHDQCLDNWGYYVPTTSDNDK